MFDISAELQRYYDNHVRLGTKEREDLARSRDACVQRLEQGLTKLAEEGTAKVGPLESSVNQGSYAMHTLNQQPNDDYDIDVGLIFDGTTIPESALEARRRVLDGMLKGSGGTFSKDPEMRTNAVTVWYADGYHVDLAVYRRVTSNLGKEHLEHAGTNWATRNPNEVLEWFTAAVKDKEPQLLIGTPTVAMGQLRRIVRLVKAFTKSRASWDLPGGMIVTTLVVETLRSDAHRDDVALYKSLVSLRDRLRGSIEVASPVDPGSMLTSKPKFQGQVRRLLKRLEEVVPKLAILNDYRCRRKDALEAWNAVFRHQFWGDAIDEAERDLAAASGPLEVDVGVARSSGGKILYPYRDVGPVLPKGMWLRFRLRSTDSLNGCELRWLVRNTGDEATEARDLTHQSTTDVSDSHWESTKYRGVHTMTCEAISDGTVVARGARRVRIGSR